MFSTIRLLPTVALQKRSIVWRTFRKAHGLWQLTNSRREWEAETEKHWTKALHVIVKTKTTWLLYLIFSCIGFVYTVNYQFVWHCNWRKKHSLQQPQGYLYIALLFTFIVYQFVRWVSFGSHPFRDENSFPAKRKKGINNHKANEKKWIARTEFQFREKISSRKIDETYNVRSSGSKSQKQQQNF